MSDARGDIDDERDRQDEKWGEQNHVPLRWYAILGEEFGEVGKAINEHDLRQCREELVQVAAVAIAFVESLDRNELNPVSDTKAVEGDW